MLPGVAHVALVVITYPVWSSQDRSRIDALRSEHDPLRAGVVDPHLTLVSPTASLQVDALQEHTRSHAEAFGPITLLLDRLDVVEDDSGAFFHTFLVPTIGYEQVVALHDALYRPPLDAELRRDIEYVPHVGVGTGARTAMIALAEQLRREGVTIPARLKELTIARYDGTKVHDLVTVPLGHS